MAHKHKPYHTQMQPKEDEVLPKAPEECQRWKRACHFFFRTTSKEQEWILQRTALQNRTTAQQQRNRLAPQRRTPHSTAPNDKQVGRRKVVWWMRETAAGAEREHRTLHEVTPTTETGRDRPHALPGVQRGGDGTHRSVCPEGPAATHGHGAGRGAQHSPRDPPRR